MRLPFRHARVTPSYSALRPLVSRRLALPAPEQHDGGVAAGACPMHGHSLSFVLTAGGFLVAVLALVFQILAYRRGK